MSSEEKRRRSRLPNPTRNTLVSKPTRRKKPPRIPDRKREFSSVNTPNKTNRTSSLIVRKKKPPVPVKRVFGNNRPRYSSATSLRGKKKPPPSIPNTENRFPKGNSVLNPKSPSALSRRRIPNSKSPQTPPPVPNRFEKPLNRRLPSSPVSSPLVERGKPPIDELVEKDFRRCCRSDLNIIPLLVPQQVTLRGQSKPSDEILLQLVSDKKVDTICLCGEGGSGKTCALVKLTHKLFGLRKKNLIKFTVLYVPLRTIAKSCYKDTNDTNNLLVNYLSERILPIYSKQEISDWLKNQELLLVMDGYDELEQDGLPGRSLFPYLAEILMGSPGNIRKVVVGTRRSVIENTSSIVASSKNQDRKREAEKFLKLFFNLQGFGRGQSDSSDHVQILDVLKFRISDVNDYLSRFAVHHHLFTEFHGEIMVFRDSNGKVDKFQYMKTMKEIPGLLKLCSNPNMMFMIFKFLPRIVAELGSEDDGKRMEMTRARVFEAVIHSWFEREAKRLAKKAEFQEKEFSALLIENLMQIYSRNLAKQQFERGRMKQVVSKSESLDPGLLVGFDESKRGLVSPEMLEYVRNSCLQTISEDRFMFFHNSVIEFFAMKNLVKEIGGMGQWLYEANKSNRRESFFTKNISSEKGVLQFMVEKLKELLQIIGRDGYLCIEERAKRKEMNLLDQLFHIIDCSRRFPRLLSIAAANALTILCYSRVALSGLNFQKICARHTDFYQAFLDRTDFTNSDLTGSLFNRCLLWETKFDSSCLRECLFDIVPFEKERKSLFDRINTKERTEMGQCSLISRCGKYHIDVTRARISVRELKATKEVLKINLQKNFLTGILSYTASSVVKAFTYPDGKLLVGFTQKDTTLVHGNDIFLIDIERLCLLEKKNSSYRLTSLPLGVENMKVVHVSLDENNSIFIWAVFRYQGKMKFWVVGKSGFFNNDEDSFIVKLDWFDGCRDDEQVESIVSCDGAFNVIYCSKKIYVYDRKIELCHEIPTSRPVIRMHHFFNDFICVLCNPVVKLKGTEDRYDVYRILETGVLLPLGKEEMEIPGTNTMVISPNRPLFLVKKGKSDVLEVRNFQKKDVEGTVPYRSDGKYLFHDKENYVFFGKRLVKIDFKERVEEEEETKSNFMCLTDNDVVLGRNKRCFVTSMDGAEKIVLEDGKEIVIRKIDDYELLSRSAAVVNSENEVISAIAVGSNLYWKNQTKDAELKIDLYQFLKGRLDFQIINKTKKLADDEEEEEGEKNEESSLGTFFVASLSLSDCGYSLSIVTIAGDVYYWKAGSEFRTFLVDTRLIARCAKLWSFLGVTGKLIGSVLGTIKSWNLCSCFGAGGRFLYVYDIIGNRVKCYDVETKKILESRTKRIPRVSKNFIVEVIFDLFKSSKGDTMEEMMDRWSSFYLQMICTDGRIGITSSLFQAQDFVTEIASFQIFNNSIHVKSVMQEDRGTVFPADIQMNKTYGLSPGNCAILKGFCRKKCYSPHFGYIRHEALRLDPRTQLEEGDVLLKYSDGLDLRAKVVLAGYVVDEAISLFFSGKRKQPHENFRPTHAAVYVGEGQLVEATGKRGVILNYLTGNKALREDYMVFRLRGRRKIKEEVAQFCVNIMDDQRTRRNVDSSGYDTVGAFFSVILRNSKNEDKRKSEYEKISRGQKKSKKKFFCSELVVHVYQLAEYGLSEECVINLDSYRTNPKRLYEYLVNDENWEYVGNVTNSEIEESEEAKRLRKEGEMEEEVEGEEVEGWTFVGQNEPRLSVWQKNVKIVEDYHKAFNKQTVILEKAQFYLNTKGRRIV